MHRDSPAPCGSRAQGVLQPASIRRAEAGVKEKRPGVESAPALTRGPPSGHPGALQGMPGESLLGYVLGVDGLLSADGAGGHGDGDRGDHGDGEWKVGENGRLF
jgi:hypothetical protein